MPLWRGPFSHRYSQRHPLGCLLGRGMVCLLWIQYLIDILPQFLQLFMQYLSILDHVITALDCIRLLLSYYSQRTIWVVVFWLQWLNLGHGWVISPHCFTRTYVLTRALIPILVWLFSIDECNWNFTQNDDNHAVVLCTCTICRNDSVTTFMNEWNFARLGLECYFLWVCCSGLRPLTARVPGHQLKNDKNR